MAAPAGVAAWQNGPVAHLRLVTLNDRIALVLGHTLLRALAAEHALEAQSAEIAAIKAEQERLAALLEPDEGSDDAGGVSL